MPLTFKEKPESGSNFNIDARGADPVLTGQRVEDAIRAALPAVTGSDAKLLTGIFHTGESQGKREVRFFKQELRAETGDGKIFLVGYTALYNSLSQNLGTSSRPWKERIMPGAFTRALSEQHDVRHLKNHDPNYVLGRTKAGTLTLIEDSTGLRYRTLLPDTSYAKDLAASIERGDIDEQSFGFVCHKESWVFENGVDIRQLEDLSLADISTVTYPAYLGTSAALSTRTMFPDGIPAEVRSRMMKPKADEESGVCDCQCPGCLLSDCATCSDESCDDPYCRDCPMQNVAKAKLALAAVACQCKCESCVAGACQNCSDTACGYESCKDCPQQNSVSDAALIRDWTSHASLAIRLRDLSEKRDKVKALYAVVPMERRSAVVKEDGTLELYAYGDIGPDCFGDGITAQGFKDEMAAAPDHTQIRMCINSFGGDAFEGIAICNLLKAQEKPVEVRIDGLAASAASIIAMAGDKGKIMMANNAMMMIHNASTSTYGYASDMRKTADVLDKISTAVAQTYVDRVKMSMKNVKAVMDAETWMTAADCVKDGFADGITPEERSADQGSEIATLVRSSRAYLMYRNVPERFNTAALDLIEAEERERIRLRTAAAIAL